MPVELEPAGRAVPGWVAAGDEPDRSPAEQWVALLPGLDPTTMGWKQREWYLPAPPPTCSTRNGNAGPAIWADGGWSGRGRRRPDGEIRTRYFVDVPAAAPGAPWTTAVEALPGLVGETRFTVRFPGRGRTGRCWPERSARAVRPTRLGLAA